MRKRAAWLCASIPSENRLYVERFFNFYTFKAEGLNGNRRTNTSLQTKPLPLVYGTGRMILQIACFNVKEVYRKPPRNGYSVYGFSSR